VVAQSPFYPDIPISILVHRRVAYIVVAPADTLITLAMGATTTINARPFAADSSAVTEVPVRWTLSDTTVTRFDTATKVLRGLKMGEARITVTVPVANDSTVSRTWRAKVIAGGLAFSRPGPRVALGIGERTPVEVKILDDKRQPIETASRLTWASSNDSIARIAEGQIVGVGMGRARLTARAVWDSTVTTEVTVVGELLVYALRGGRWDVYMLQRDTGAQPLRVRQMTQDTSIKSGPTWSPTLMQIAWVAAPALMGNSDLFVADADGSNVRRVTHDSATVRSPSFVGPSGDQIVFESSKDGKAQLYVIKLDGTGRRQLTRGDAPNTQPSVSPDGKNVIYGSVRDRNYDVYEMNLDGTGERRLTLSQRPEDTPEYSADGRSFYYLRDEGGNPLTKRVYRQDLTTGTATAITPVGLFVQDYSVSADGSTLALLTLAADANGVQTARVVMFNLATAAMTPVVLTGTDRVAGPAFRPATPH
jgi:Tol biopolymer transport system component